MLNSRFAVLDDSPDDQNLVAAILCNVGATVKKFGHANDLFRALRIESFDALIVDWNMPDITGVEAVERIRRDMLIDVPIILVTSRNEDHEIVAGLHAGADDFITKPASAGILIARLNAVLRRQSNQLITSGEENFGEYAFDVPNRAVTRHGQTIGYFIPTHGQAEADVASLKKASKTLDRLLAAKSVDEDAVIAEFRTARKRASMPKKSKSVVA